MLKRIPETGATVLPRRGAVDLRASATMWSILVWAYKRELVRYCEGRVATHGARGFASSSATARVGRALEGGFVGDGGSHVGLASFPVHPDAEWIHGLVRSLDRDEYRMIVKSAEAGEHPQWDPEIEPARVVPVLRANGKPRMLCCTRSGRPIACLIEVHGLARDDADAIRSKARENYARWFRLVAALRDKVSEDDALTRWRITGIGAHPQPWMPV